MDEINEKQSSLKKYVDSLLKEREEYSKKIQKIDKVLNSVREICEHSYEYVGHDSHHDIEECSICKKQIY